MFITEGAEMAVTYGSIGHSGLGSSGAGKPWKLLPLCSGSVQKLDP